MRNPSSSSGSAASKSTPTPCCSKVGLKRGPWTPEEDEVLANYIRREGEGRWRTLPKRAGLLRCGKSCRLRWMNYLRPSVKRGPIAPDEEDLILRLHRLLGNRWALIAGRIPGRTDNEIKNYWNTHLSKKLINQGLDPRTHKPLNPNPNPNPNPNSSRIVYFATPNRPNPNPNPNPNISDHENCYQATVNKSSEDSKVTNLDKYQNPLVNTSDHHENCQNSSVGLMSTGLQSNHGNGEHEIEFCNEDTFSSFLNSLINEDVFGNQQYQQQANAAIAPPASSSLLQPVILPPSVQTFNHGTIWEAALTSSNMAGLGDEQNRFN